MAAKPQHGSRYGYVAGCRCPDCTAAQRLYQRRWRERQLYGDDVAVAPAVVGNPTPGSVEAAVLLELAGLPEAQERPGLAAAALEMGRVLDHPRVITAKPAAAGRLAALLDELHKAGGRRGRLSVVRAMATEHDGA